MLTALVRDLKLTYKEGIELHIHAQYPDIWRHNPHIASLNPEASVGTLINLDKGRGAVDRIGIAESHRGSGGHYLTFFHKAFSERARLPVDVLYSKADLHLSEQEKAEPLVEGKYWIVVPGFKTDMTTKAYHSKLWQEVVDGLRKRGHSIVQEGATKPSHINPTLNGVLDLVGHTSIRDMIRNIYHAQGVICGVSLPMHIAGALEKPCVAIMGGREEPSYELYSGQFAPTAEPVKIPHVMMDTIGKLNCCKKRGCWLRRVVPLKDGKDIYNKSLCKEPDLSDPNEPVASCMNLITPDQIIQGAMSYYERGILA
jgi:ADP-heptose:LPS heptosyltransferase